MGLQLGALLASAALLLIGAGCGQQEEAPEEAEAAPPPPAPVRAELPPVPTLLATRTVILTYHDMVRKRDSKALWFDCTPEELKEQIAWLRKEGAVFVSLVQVHEGLLGKKPLPDRAVALCFADNYQGFYDMAWPILKEEGIPVTLFVHTGHVGSQKGRHKMTWETLAELSESPLISIQSQTVNHPPDISKLDEGWRMQEYLGSREALSRGLGLQAKMIAYPNGKYSREASNQAWTAGYDIGFTEEQEAAELAPTLMEVPRVVHTRMKKAWREARRQAKEASPRREPGQTGR